MGHGEINDAQRAAWCRTIQVVDDDYPAPTQIALLPDNRAPPALDCDVVQVRLSRPASLGAARQEAGRAYYLLTIHLPEAHEPVTAETFTGAINRKKSFCSRIAKSIGWRARGTESSKLG